MAVSIALLLVEGGDASKFWRDHPLATNLASGVLMALLLVFGLDRFQAARARRRARPYGLMVVDEVECCLVADQIISDRVLTYCHRRFGAYEIPPKMHFREILGPALEDLRAWEPAGDVPAMVDEIREWTRQLDECFTKSAPLMVIDPALTEIVAGIPPLLEMLDGILWALEQLDQRRNEPDSVWVGPWRENLSRALAADLGIFGESTRALVSKISRYRTGRPLRLHYPVPVRLARPR